MLVIHLGMVAYCSSKSSPTWDEPAHLAAGIAHWRHGNFRVYSVNPPLVRMVAAAPSLLLGSTHRLRGYDPDPVARCEFFLGHNLISDHKTKLRSLFRNARWACLPFTAIGALTCYAWARSLWGPHAGIIALALWILSPSVIGYGHLFSPDLGAASLGLLAAYSFGVWLEKPSWANAAAAGVALGFAQLTKMTWLILFPLWPIIWVVALRFTNQGERPPLTQLVSTLIIAIVVLNAGYGFAGSLTTLRNYEFVSESLSGADPGGSVFRGSILESLPVPFPRDYVRGIDLQKRDFENGSWSYLRGEWRKGGWWYYYLYALLIKVPAAFWLLLLLAGLSTAFVRTSITRNQFLLLLAPPLSVILLVSSQTGFNHHFRYVLPALPFLIVAAARVGVFYSERKGSHWFHAARAATIIAIFGLGSSSLLVYPHSLTFFNVLAGGPTQGHQHLLDSNTDWGQNHFYLQDWLEQHPEVKSIRLALTGIPMSTKVMIPHEEPPRFDNTNSNGLYGLEPGWYGVSLNRIHDTGDHYLYFLYFEPVEIVGNSIAIFRLSPADIIRFRNQTGGDLNQIEGVQRSL